MRKNHLALLGLGALLATGAPALGDAETYTGDGQPPSTYCGSATTCDLIVGNDAVDAGTVTVVNDENYLYVTFALDTTGDPDAEFGTLHVGVYATLGDVPGGGCQRPAPGQLAWQVDATGLTEYTFQLPLGTLDLPVECGTTSLIVVAHAEVNGEEFDGTGFGGCVVGPRSCDGEHGNQAWWYYMTHTVQCCGGGGEGGTFQTAYAKGTWVWTTDRKSNPEDLDSLRLTKNRWGWAIRLCEPGETTYEIWAGAGLNDTAKGTLVGTATVVWDGSEVTVTYDMDDGYTMAVIHVYAGAESPDTIAPGQYGWIESFDPYADYDETTLPLVDTDDDGCVWVVMHAEVFGDF